MPISPGFVPSETVDDVVITDNMSEEEVFEAQKDIHRIQRMWMLVSAQEKAQDETIKTIIRNI